MKIIKRLTGLFVGTLLAGNIAFAQEQPREVIIDREATYNDKGRFAVQVDAWRSEKKAEKRLSVWKDRGYSHSRFVKHGIEETGDIWFRVHLGRFGSVSHAREFQKVFAEAYSDETWITTTL